MANDDRNRESTRNSGRSGQEDESLRNPGAGSRSGGMEPGQSEVGASRRGESEMDEQREGSDLGRNASGRGSNPASGEEENEDTEQPGEE
jgi:hypothetical protein